MTFRVAHQPPTNPARCPYRVVVKANWLSVPLSDASGLLDWTETRPTRIVRRVAIAR